MSYHSVVSMIIQGVHVGSDSRMRTRIICLKYSTRARTRYTRCVRIYVYTCTYICYTLLGVVRLKMAGLGMWLRMAGTMAAVMLVGWGLMKTTSPSVEDVMNVRTDYMSMPAAASSLNVIV